jgi:hypothetical protein
MRTWKSKRERRRVRCVEFKFVCADPILPEIVGAVAPAGVDCGALTRVLHFAHVAGVGPVRAGVVFKSADHLHLREGRAMRRSWWAEASGSDGVPRSVSDQASLVDALDQLVRVTSAATGERRQPITWIETNWGASPIEWTHGSLAAVAEALRGAQDVVAGRAAESDRAGAAPENSSEPVAVVDETAESASLWRVTRAIERATEAINSGRTFELQAAGNNPNPYRMEPGGKIDRWGKNLRARVVGFADDMKTVKMSVDLPGFYGDPQRAVGKRPVFEFPGARRWTHDEPIVSVRATKEEDW